MNAAGSAVPDSSSASSLSVFPKCHTFVIIDVDLHLFFTVFVLSSFFCMQGSQTPNDALRQGMGADWWWWRGGAGRGARGGGRHVRNRQRVHGSVVRSLGQSVSQSISLSRWPCPSLKPGALHVTVRQGVGGGASVLQTADTCSSSVEKQKDREVSHPKQTQPFCRVQCQGSK